MSLLPDDTFIQPDELKIALKTSGYLLEGRIAQALEAKGFYVELNSFWSDPRDEGKSIEIDVWGRFGEVVNADNRSVVVVEPLIECKNNSQPVAFFMKTQPVREINDNHIKYAGFPKSSADPETKLHFPLHKLLTMQEWHHYCQTSEVATQFCSFTRDHSLEEQKRKGQKLKGNRTLARKDWSWKTESMENYSKSFGNLCIVTELTGVGGFTLDRQNIELEFYYPIIVFQGPIYEVRVKGGEIDVKETEHLQFHHSASAEGQIVRAQIDVVSENGFPALIDKIFAELTRTVAGAREHEERLMASAIDQKRVAFQSQLRASLGHIGQGHSRY